MAIFVANWKRGLSFSLCYSTGYLRIQSIIQFLERKLFYPVKYKQQPKLSEVLCGLNETLGGNTLWKSLTGLECISILQKVVEFITNHSPMLKWFPG